MVNTDGEVETPKTGKEEEKGGERSFKSRNQHEERQRVKCKAGPCEATVSIKKS